MEPASSVSGGLLHLQQRHGAVESAVEAMVDSIEQAAGESYPGPSVLDDTGRQRSLLPLCAGRLWPAANPRLVERNSAIARRVIGRT